MNKFKVFIAISVLSGTIGANVFAKEIKVSDNAPMLEEVKQKQIKTEEVYSLNNNSDQAPSIPKKEHYTIKPYDTLSEIAITHDVTVEEIKVWNELSTNLIHPGREIILFHSSEEVTPNSDPKSDNKESIPSDPAELETEVNNDLLTNNTQNTGDNQNETEVQGLTVTATAYTASCEGCSGITATGVNILDNPDEKVIAVDPSVIPLGSKVYVEGYGYATAADTGGAIKGNKIDVFIPEHQDAINWGVKKVEVTVLN
jgi:3D (Asp-Asp-Asp) domain-containing protein